MDRKWTENGPKMSLKWTKMNLHKMDINCESTKSNRKTSVKVEINSATFRTSCTVKPQEFQWLYGMTPLLKLLRRIMKTIIRCIYTRHMLLIIPVYDFLEDYLDNVNANNEPQWKNQGRNAFF